MDATVIEELTRKLMDRIEFDRCVHKSSIIDVLSAFNFQQTINPYLPADYERAMNGDETYRQAYKQLLEQYHDLELRCKGLKREHGHE